MGLQANKICILCLGSRSFAMVGCTTELSLTKNLTFSIITTGTCVCFGSQLSNFQGFLGSQLYSVQCGRQSMRGVRTCTCNLRQQLFAFFLMFDFHHSVTLCIFNNGSNVVFRPLSVEAPCPSVEVFQTNFGTVYNFEAGSRCNMKICCVLTYHTVTTEIQDFEANFFNSLCCR